MRNSILTLAAAAVAIVGCSTTAPSEPAPANPEGGSCNDSGLSSYVGQTYSDALGAEMKAKSGAQALRVVHDGEVVTMEFNANRLTVMLDGNNRVTTARCG